MNVNCINIKRVSRFNDYSTYLCTVDGVAVPLQPFAIARVVCKLLLRNSYAIYRTQAGRVIIVKVKTSKFHNIGYLTLLIFFNHTFLKCLSFPWAIFTTDLYCYKQTVTLQSPSLSLSVHLDRFHFSPALPRPSVVRPSVRRTDDFDDKQKQTNRLCGRWSRTCRQNPPSSAAGCEILAHPFSVGGVQIRIIGIGKRISSSTSLSSSSLSHYPSGRLFTMHGSAIVKATGKLSQSKPL